MFFDSIMLCLAECDLYHLAKIYAYIENIMSFGMICVFVPISTIDIYMYVRGYLKKAIIARIRTRANL